MGLARLGKGGTLNRRGRCSTEGQLTLAWRGYAASSLKEDGWR